PPSFFFQAENAIRAFHVTGVQTCALPISGTPAIFPSRPNSVNEVLYPMYGTQVWSGPHHLEVSEGCLVSHGRTHLIALGSNLTLDRKSVVEGKERRREVARAGTMIQAREG